MQLWSTRPSQSIVSVGWGGAVWRAGGSRGSLVVQWISAARGVGTVTAWEEEESGSSGGFCQLACAQRVGEPPGRNATSRSLAVLGEVLPQDAGLRLCGSRRLPQECADHASAVAPSSGTVTQFEPDVVDCDVTDVAPAWRRVTGGRGL